MILGPFITGYDPLKNDMGARLLAPSANHWFGTDEMGRDLFCRLAYGAWYSMGTALAVVLSAAGVGIVLGGIAGYIGGWFDNLIMRLCDIFMSFPQIFFGYDHRCLRWSGDRGNDICTSCFMVAQLRAYGTGYGYFY